MTKNRRPKGREPWPAFYLLSVALLALALVSVVLLDFINRNRGEPSYFFPKREKKPAAAVPAKAPPSERPLADVLAESLAKVRVPRDAIRTSERPDGTAEVEVRLAAAAYGSLDARLEKELKRAKITVAGKTSGETEQGTEYLWDIRRGEREKAALLFVCPAEPKPEVKPAAPPPEPRVPPAKGTRVLGEVALIVDDMGENLGVLDDILSLREPVTISVLPYSQYAQETARKAHENKLEVLLHLPLESLNNHDAATGTEGLITSVMTPEEIVASFDASYSRVPFADGVNNHMGSRFTADAGLMRTLLEPLKEKGLFFVDSRTTAQTVGYTEALRMGIPSVERNVFLDADADRRLIRSRLLELFQKARKEGHAVGICHPFPETIKVLKSSFGLLKNYNLEAVPVSRLVHK